MFRDMGDSEGAEMEEMLLAAERYLRERLAGGLTLGWLAEVDGCAVAGGVIDVLPWIPGYLDPTPRRAYVHNLYTEPSFRRRGIARMLMQTMVAWCREQGFRSVALHASDQGRALYEAMDFVGTNEMRLAL